MKLSNKKIKQQLQELGIDPTQVDALHIKIKQGEISHDSFKIDKSRLKPPTKNDYDNYNNLNLDELKQIGEDSIKNDELLIFWLNGGAATRYFDESKITDQEKEKYILEIRNLTPEIKKLPKGITPVFEDITFLELKIKNLLKITEDLNLKKHPQVILMNSFLTDEKTREHLNLLYQKYPKLDPKRFHFIVQKPTVPRFAKQKNLEDIDLFIDENNNLSFSPCGHGDFLYLTQEYLKQEGIPKVKYMFFNNIDNFGTYIDPTLLGYHIKSKKGRTVELAAKNPGDKGGAPCFVDDNLMIIEDMKFPKNFNQDDIKVFNTNNFWFTIPDLINYDQELPLIIAEKVIPEGEVYQLEHFACDVNLPSTYIEVPRERRFLPSKRYVDILIYKDPQSKYYENFKNLLKNQYNLQLP